MTGVLNAYAIEKTLREIAEIEQRNHILAIGARAIYELRSNRAPWDKVVPETRRAYECRMQELLNELAKAGYVVRKE